MRMSTLLEQRVIGNVCAENTAAIAAAAADESLSWEEVSRIASEGNARLAQLMQTLPGTIEKLADEAMMHGYAVGMNLVEQALPHTDPEYHLELFEGASFLAMRARQQLEAGGILPMDYMNMGTRKEIFLVESALGGPKKKR